MKLSRKWYVMIIAVIACILLISVIRKDKEGAELYYTIDNYKINIEKLFEYKGAYVGDNSAVGNIINLSPGSEYFRGFALQTDKEPYGINIEYGVDTSEDNEKYQWLLNDSKVLDQMILNNASILFSLVKNVEKIEWYFEGENDVKYTISRKQIQEYYDEDIIALTEDKKLWKKKIADQTLMNDSRVEAFFKTYPQVISRQQEGEETITLYFGGSNAESLVGESALILDPTPKKAIEALIMGPKDESLYRTMPDNIKVIDVSTYDKIATVNFSTELEEALNGNYGSSAASVILLYSIVNTLTLNEVFEIDKVKIIVEGKDVGLGPFGILEPQGPDLEIVR